MISRYEDLYPLLLVDLPHCDESLVLQSLQQAGREFCRRTEAWTEKLTYNIVDASQAGDDAYDTAIAASMSVAAAIVARDNAEKAARSYTIKPSYDAEISRLWKVWTNGSDLPTDPLVDPISYSFNPATNVLAFNSNLQTYTPTATTWVTSHAYTVGQYVIQSSLRYLCSIAHTSGTFATDLSNNKWKLMNNDLIVRPVLVPRLFCCELGGWFMEKWAEAIIAKAKALLMAMKNKNWSSPERVSFFENEYNKYIAIALREKFVENKNTGAVFSTPAWIK